MVIGVKRRRGPQARASRSPPPNAISGAAGQLLPEQCELLVAGQRARRGGLTAARGVVGRRRLAAGLGLGIGGLGDLPLVLLEALVSAGVLPLPLLALLVEAFLPLLGLRVEALGIDVVAVLVVLGGHAVPGRVELHFRAQTLVGLLERQRDPPPVQVD